MTTTDPTTSTAITTTNDAATIAPFSSAGSLEAAQRAGKALAASSLMPEAFRNNLPNVLIAMELANRIGASVFMVAQNLDVIHGRPSFRATFLIATVNRSGRFSPLRFRWEGKPGTDAWGCRAVATDRETGEECIGALITLGLAKAEGWSKKQGSKWLTMPEQMLMYRAASFWSRVYAPELLMGMGTSDEAEDIGARRALSYVEPVDVASPKSLEASLLADEAPAAPKAAPSQPASDPPDFEREPGADDE